MKTRKIYKAAVIGLGRMGSTFNNEDKSLKGIWTHAGAYSSLRSVKLIAGADPDEKKRVKFLKLWGIKNVYSDSMRLFKNHRLDIVSICCPTKFHFKEAMECICHKVKAIFLEKPIAFSVQEAKTIVNLCRKKKLVLAVDHIRRWDDNYILAKQLISRQDLGRVINIIGYYPKQIFNIGTHLIDAMRYYGGSVKAVAAEFTERDKIDPTVSGYLRFTNGVRGFIVPQGSREKLIFELDILCRNGRIKILDNGRRLELYKFKKSKNCSGYQELSRKQIKLVERKKDRMTAAVKDILQCIEKKAQPLCSGFDGLAALSVCLALVKSAKEKGQMISFKKSW